IPGEGIKGVQIVLRIGLSVSVGVPSHSPKKLDRCGNLVFRVGIEGPRPAAGRNVDGDQALFLGQIFVEPPQVSFVLVHRRHIGPWNARDGFHPLIKEEPFPIGVGRGGLCGDAEGDKDEAKRDPGCEYFLPHQFLTTISVLFLAWSAAPLFISVFCGTLFAIGKESLASADLWYYRQRVLLKRSLKNEGQTCWEEPS